MLWYFMPGLLADHAMALQVKHKCCLYTLWETVDEWVTQVSFLWCQSGGLPHLNEQKFHTDMKCWIQPWQCWSLLFYFISVIPNWSVKPSALGRAEATLVVGRCWPLFLSWRSPWCCKKCPWELSLSHGSHCKPKQEHDWANRNRHSRVSSCVGSRSEYWGKDLKLQVLLVPLAVHTKLWFHE